MEKIFPAIAALVFFAVLVGCELPQIAVIDGQPIIKTYLAEVVGVTDGDTITVLDQEKNQHVIRLASIDCPEKDQPFSNAAKQRCSELCFHRSVQVHQTGVDQYNRELAYVDVDSKNLNFELVANGMAWHAKFSSSVGLADAEAKAQQSKLGLWEDPNPISPWAWRRQQESRQ